MVVTCLPATAANGVTQERVGTPSTCTVQAPQMAMPQPYFVPVRSRWSRSTQRSGVVASTSNACRSPFTHSSFIGSPSP